MASKTVLIDDIDGGEAQVTIVFAINGESYQLDLSQTNANRFHKALKPFIDAAAGLKEAHRNEVDEVAAAVNKRNQIRAWAKKKGYDVAERGKIPKEVLDAFDASH